MNSNRTAWLSIILFPSSPWEQQRLGPKCPKAWPPIHLETDFCVKICVKAFTDESPHSFGAARESQLLLCTTSRDVVQLIANSLGHVTHSDRSLGQRMVWVWVGNRYASSVTDDMSSSLPEAINPSWIQLLIVLKDNKQYCYVQMRVGTTWYNSYIYAGHLNYIQYKVYSPVTVGCRDTAVPGKATGPPRQFGSSAQDASCGSEVRSSLFKCHIVETFFL